MIKCKIIVIGHIPCKLNISKLENWKSDIFKITNKIETFALNIDSDGEEWEYSDKSIKTRIPDCEEDFLLAIVNVPLSDGYYARRVDTNKAVITMFEMQEILNNNNIPLENLILRVIYAYTLIYMSEKKLPSINDSWTNNYTHDETRSCIYDMTGIKNEIVYSCNEPILCSSCEEKFLEKLISVDVLNKVKKEMKKIKKERYFRIADYVKAKPIRAFIFSSTYAVILGILGSLIAGRF